eukprot:c27457_g1_i2 orf=222-1256(-)
MALSPITGLFATILAVLVSVQIVGSSPVLVAQVTASGSDQEYVVKLNVGSPLRSELFRLDISDDFVYLQCANLTAVESITFNTTDGKSIQPELTVQGVNFTCIGSADQDGAEGILGLSQGNHSLPAQLATKSEIARKFAYCLTGGSSPGPIFFGSGVDYVFQPGKNLSASLSFTPLKKQLNDYAVTLEDIVVDSAALNLKNHTVRLSSVQLYTKLTTPIYLSLRSAFRSKAASRNFTRVASVSPFDTCYNSSSISVTILGYAVPEVDLKLGGNVTWPLFGSSSVVSVSDSVICLAFLDAGPIEESVLGTYQQQDHLIQYDLEGGKFGFTGPLNGLRTACSDFKF